MYVRLIFYMLFKVVRLGNSGKKFKKVSCAFSTQPFEYLNIFKVDFSVVTTSYQKVIS